MRWIPRFRFRVATLLIAVTAVCVWLAIVTQRMRSQQAALEVIERLGGRVAFDYHYLEPSGPVDGPMDLEREPSAPAGARRLLGEDFFRTPLCVAIQGKTITPADMRSICALRRLRTLRLLGCNLSSRALEEVSSLQALESLSLLYSRLGDGRESQVL